MPSALIKIICPLHVAMGHTELESRILNVHVRTCTCNDFQIENHVHVGTVGTCTYIMRIRTRSKKNELPWVDVHVHVQYESKKSPISVPVPFCYGKTGDFFHPVLPVPFRSARIRAHVYKFYISRDRPIERSSAKRQPSFQVA